MSNKTNNCPVHGDKMANEVHNYSAKKAEVLGHPEMTVDPNCTCDVGVTGPAGDPELLAKSKEPIKNPHTPEPTGPAAE